MSGKKARKRIVRDVPRSSDWLHRPEPVGTISNVQYEQPRRLKGESAEQREKRLARREALTLEAFRVAYENHHKRKDP